jgi:glutathione S-transferase
MRSSKKNVTGHQLFYYSTCPFCLVVRFALWRLGLKIPLKEILYHPKNNADLVAGGGKSQVPCLRIESESGDIQWLYESTDIIQYLKNELAT